MVQPDNVQRNRAVMLRVDFRFRQIRRSGSRNCYTTFSRVGMAVVVIETSLQLFA